MGRKALGGRYLTFWLPPEIKQELVTVAYMMGHAGVVAKVVRKFLIEGVKKYKAGLTPKQQKDFDLILGNVQIRNMLTAPTGERKTSKYIKKKERGG